MFSTTTWKKKKLGDVLTFQRGHDLPAEKRKAGIIPVVASTGIVGYHSELKSKGPGVIIGRSGSIGGGQYIDGDFWPLNTTLYVVDFQGNDPLFCYYLLRSIDFSKWNAGSGVPTLNRNHIHMMDVKIPDLKTQKEIAHILGTLDDKIELNRRMNKTLEDIAQALFKHWFIDFEFPNEEGRPYKSSGGEMVDSELGQIPIGWRVGSLNEIASFLNGLALQKYPPNGTDDLPVIKIAQLNSGNTYNADRANPSVPTEYQVNDGDVLFSWSGSLDVKIWGGGKGALNQHLFKVTSDRYPMWWYYFWLKEHLEEFRRIAAGKATTMGHIQRRHLAEAKITMPGKQTIDYAHTVINETLQTSILDLFEVENCNKVKQLLIYNLFTDWN